MANSREDSIRVAEIRAAGGRLIFSINLAASASSGFGMARGACAGVDLSEAIKTDSSRSRLKVDA